MTSEISSQTARVRTRWPGGGDSLPLATFLAVALSLAPGNVRPEPPESDVRDDQYASETSVDLTLDGSAWTVDYRRVESETTDQTNLALRPPDSNEPSIETVLPGWAGPPAYEIEVETGSLDAETVAVLSTLRPTPGSERDPNSTILQVAWLGRRSAPGAYRWELLRRVEHSGLEGGPRLSFTEDDRRTRLVETRRQLATRLCGPVPDSSFVRAVYRPDEGRFVWRVNLDRRSKNTRRVEASLPDEPLTGPFTSGVYQWYWATSSFDTSSKTSNVVRPLELGDRRGGTAWTIDARQGLKGHFATANVLRALPVRGLHIVPGLPKDPNSYRDHARPERLLVSFSDGTHFSVSIPEVPYRKLVARRGLVVEFPEPVRTSCMSVMHLTARGGSSSGGGPRPVSIAEIALITTADAPTASRTARRIVELVASESELQRRRRLTYVANGVRAELGPAVEEALDGVRGVERRRILPLLDKLDAEQAVPILLEFYENLDADAVEFRAVKRSLATRGSRTAKRLIELLEEFEPDHPKYVDTVRLLGRVGELDHLEALTDDFGLGDRTVRNERIRAVAGAGEPILDRLFAVVEANPSGEATRDALKAISLLGRRKYRNERGTHPDSEQLLDVLTRDHDRRTLLYALRAARYFEIEGLLDYLRKTLDDHSDPLVRKAVVSTVARIPSDGARRYVESALADPSPDVRIAAASGIENRSDRRRSVGPLLGYVREEDWSSGQEKALEVLAAVEVPETQTFFRQLVRNRRNSAQALRAARALSRHSRPLDASLARKIILDERADGRLRLQMVELLGFDDSREGESFLSSLLPPKRRSREIENPNIREEVELRALMSLGRRRTDSARSRLLEIAESDYETSRRRRAIRALGFFRDEQLAERLDSWQSQAPPDLRRTIGQTVEIIQNRDRIERVGREIDQTLDLGRDNDSGPSNESE